MNTNIILKIKQCDLSLVQIQSVYLIHPMYPGWVPASVGVCIEDRHQAKLCQTFRGGHRVGVRRRRTAQTQWTLSSNSARRRSRGRRVDRLLLNNRNRKGFTEHSLAAESSVRWTLLPVQRGQRNQRTFSGRRPADYAVYASRPGPASAPNRSVAVNC